MNETYYVLEHEHHGYWNVLNTWGTFKNCYRFHTMEGVTLKRNQFTPETRPLVHICEMTVTVKRLEK